MKFVATTSPDAHPNPESIFVKIRKIRGNITTASPTRSHIAANTLVVAACFGLAAAAGLFRNIIIAQHFTIGAELDAYYAAFKLPDLLFTIVAGGALATAFIPVFADFLAQENRAGAWRLASAITNWVVLIVAIGAGLAGLAAPWLVRRLIAPGFDAAGQAAAADLMRLVLVSTLLFGISSVQTSALHGFKHFLLPALAPVFYPLGIAAGAIWFVPVWGVRGLAMGAVLGAALHLAAKIPALLRYGFRWQPVLDGRSPAVRRVAVLMGPRILDLAVFQFTLIATTNLASRLPAGSVSGLEWGWDAMQLPETIIGTAFGLVAFPTFAELAARHDFSGLRQTLGETTRAVLALAVPAALGLILLGQPLLDMLYGGGSFDSAAITAIYTALRFFALGLAAHTVLELAARAFFAQQDTLTPLFVAIGSAVVSIGLGIVLMQAMGHGGLALANSIAVSAEVLVLFALRRRRWGAVDGRALALTLARVLAATAVMGVTITAVLALAAARSLAPALTLALAAAAGAAAYLLACLSLRERAIFYLAAAVIRPGAKVTPPAPEML